MESGVGEEPVRILIADNIAHAVVKLEQLRPQSQVELCGMALTPEELFGETRALAPDIVLLNAAFAGVDALAAIKELRDSSPDTNVIILCEAGDSAVRARARTAGAAAVLQIDASGEEIAATAKGIKERNLVPGGAAPPGSAVGSALGGIQGLQPLPEGVAAALPDGGIQAVVPRKRKPGQTSEIFAVYSGKGGVGKSVLAANLAIAIAIRTGARVAVLDLDLQFGDLGFILGVNHTHSLSDIPDHGEQIDKDLLEPIMVKGPADTCILLAPEAPEMAELITTGMVRAILRELGREFDFIVVDTAAHLDELTIDLLENADQILAVTSHNVTSIRDVKTSIRLLTSLGIPREKVSLVLNQLRAKTSISREDIEESINFKVLAQIPYEPRLVDEAVDYGKSFVLSEPKSPASQAISALVDYLVPADMLATGKAVAPDPARAATGKAGRRRFSLGRG